MRYVHIKKRTISKSGNFHVCPVDNTDNADDRSGTGYKIRLLVIIKHVKCPPFLFLSV